MSAFTIGAAGTSPPPDENTPVASHQLSTLSRATSNWSSENIIGRGGFGPVYRGSLNNREVAIKRLEVAIGGGQGIAEFERELATLTHCRHENLLPLLGYCRAPDLCLVYPFMENGSLFDLLHLTDGRERKGALLPTFISRLELLRQVVSGLVYLHGENFVHRDIKSANILLDSLGAARIGDTGLTREVEGDFTNTQGVGSPGYVDPRYVETLELSEASDVFSFGVVMLEVLTGKPAVDRTQRPPPLYVRARRFTSWSEHADTDIDRGAEGASEGLERLGELAKRCISNETEDRPTAGAVMTEIEGLMTPQALPVPEARVRECQVCFDAEPNARLTPCQHAVVCVTCAAELKRRRQGCPICRVQIRSFDEGTWENTFANGETGESPPPAPAPNPFANATAPLATATISEEEDLQLAMAIRASLNEQGTPSPRGVRPPDLRVVEQHVPDTSTVDLAQRLRRLEEANSALVDAAESGDINKVRELLATGVDVNCSKEGDEGRTALLMAAYCGHLAVVRVLVAAEADVNKALTNGCTPLYIAAHEGHIDVVQVLVAAEADVNKAETTAGCTPLCIAAQKGHLNVVQVLVAARADVNKATTNGCTPFFMAAQKGHQNIVQALVAARADVNKALTTDGATPLFIAAGKGHLNIVQALVAARADVNKGKTNGCTPLYIAAQEGHLDVLQVLVTARADVNKATTVGWTPLMAANHRNHTSFVSYLQSVGAR
ncbi:hypothetical protein TrVE_jg3223 [Triparma verrucosa]|uniref:Uncharacterized protein n=2 Tax=Triparma verrucosa TaxID=1606542 RepID=A0A9W6ZA32_9STRA|nr:hypothetical protein TrVE_jg3223 [Triparma verrucosa]